jgi:hypothetical protein
MLISLKTGMDSALRPVNKLIIEPLKNGKKELPGKDLQLISRGNRYLKTSNK